MHPWNPEGHETRRLGSRKRKTKEEEEKELEEEEEEETEEENGEKKGPLTRWHTSTSISISSRHREPVRMHLCALACTERASADAELDNSLGTMSAAVRNLPNCRLGLAEDLHHFISYPTTSIMGDIFVV